MKKLAIIVVILLVCCGLYAMVKFSMSQDQNSNNQVEEAQIEEQVDISDSDDADLADSSASKPSEPTAPKPELSKEEQQQQMIEYFEKVKREIIEGRKFNDQTTPIDTLLTLISAACHKDRDLFWRLVANKCTAEEMTLMEGLLNSIKVVGIPVGNRSPQESDFCVIDVIGPEKTAQVCVFGYIENAWRLLIITDNPDWSRLAERSEARIRSTLSRNRK